MKQTLFTLFFVLNKVCFAETLPAATLYYKHQLGSAKCADVTPSKPNHYPTAIFEAEFKNVTFPGDSTAEATDGRYGPVGEGQVKMFFTLHLKEDKSATVDVIAQIVDKSGKIVGVHSAEGLQIGEEVESSFSWSEPEVNQPQNHYFTKIQMFLLDLGSPSKKLKSKP